jgi:hypothetical protein
MSADQKPPPSPSIEQEVDDLLAEFNGDARAAIAALLHDLSALALALDAEATTSRGFVRGRVVRPKARNRSG